jgi:hypothetical protein
VGEYLSALSAKPYTDTSAIEPVNPDQPENAIPGQCAEAGLIVAREFSVSEPPAPPQLSNPAAALRTR